MNNNKNSPMLHPVEIINSKDIDFLTQKINQETPEFGSAYPFSFFIRNENNQIIAGCNGSVVFGSIYTDQIWVHPHHRKLVWDLD